MSRRIASLLVCLAVITRANPHSHDDMPVSPPENLGRVSFEISCKPAVRADFNRGVALLHSFWHAAAEVAFRKVAAADPGCAMAYWGEAMTHLHPLLDSPNSADVDRAREALKKADAATEKSGREAAYIGTLHRFFDDYASVQTPEAYIERTTRYSDAMAALACAYPGDAEAQIFYALALLFSERPGDTSLANRRHAVAILNPLLGRFADHPGIAHYLIHATDGPQMAREGLAAARRYAAIAPAAPHALHMPSHIYARLGLWEEDIRANLASKAASEAKQDPPVGAENRLHALEFLVYAYLQTGRDEQAQALVDEAATVKASEVDPRVVENYYASVEARFPALLTVETQDWEAAARLEPLKDSLWFKQQPTLLAHAIAAGHLHDAQAGKEAAAAIDALLPKISALQPGAVAATVSDEIHAWAAFSQGEVDAAIARLRPVADRQASSGKGEVELPAREMLAEMQWLADRPEEAFQEYEASLRSDPNRFNGLLGAARAAERLGKMSVAAGYYRTLLQNCGAANGAALSVLAHAREVVAQR